MSKLFHESFQQTLPLSLNERILNEKSILQSILYQLQRENLFVRRTADNQNTYYLGRFDAFEQKPNDYMETSSCYQFIGMTNEKQTEQEHLREILQLIDTQLQVLYEKKLINKDHLIEFLTSKKLNLKLPHLYFLPNK